MNISDYLRTALLDHVFVTPYVPPTTVFAGLYTVAPTSSGGGVEVAAGDYARIPTAWSAALLGQIQNSALERFPTSGTTGSNWGTVTALGLFDTLTGGNLLFFGPLSAPVQLDINASFSIGIAQLTITLS